MKLFGLTFGPIDRPSESDLKAAVAASDERLGQESTLIYSANDFGQCDFREAARAEKDAESLTKLAPDDGFEPRPVLGGTKFPW